jgi:hypothetical protein
MCVRVKLVQLETAIRNRLVPWQYIEATMSPVRQTIFSLTGDIETIELATDCCNSATL